jgi:hypothetical protein
LTPFCVVSAQDGNCSYRIAEDFVPMTRSERVAEATAAVASPTPFIYTAMRAGLDQANRRPREWDKDAAGFGLRYGSIYAEQTIAQIFQQGTSYALHEDNRYFASGKRNVAVRFEYAIASTLLARHDDGSRSLSISAIGGAASAAFISRAWQPRSTTSAGDAAVSFGMTMAARAGINILREFSPRVLGRVLR